MRVLRTRHSRTPTRLIPRQVIRRIVVAHRRQTALWEVWLALPPDDCSLRWIDTVDGPRLRGFTMPAGPRDDCWRDASAA